MEILIYSGVYNPSFESNNSEDVIKLFCCNTKKMLDLENCFVYITKGTFLYLNLDGYVFRCSSSLIYL